MIENSTITINTRLDYVLEMLGGNKLLLGIKQLSLFGAVFGLVFATGAVSFGDAYASDDYEIDICYKGDDKQVKPKDLHKWLDKGASLGDCDDDKHSDKKFDICYKGDDKQVKPKDLHKWLDKGASLGKCHDDDDHDDDHDGYKVFVCHKGKDLKISIYALKKHLKHGDSEGKCKKDNDKKFKKHNVFTGDGPPPKKLGKKGDLYFDSWDDDSLEYYVKIAKKKWELRGTLVEPSNDCERGDILKYNKVANKWVCVDGTNLGGLTCADGEIAKWNNDDEKWECDEDLTGGTIGEGDITSFEIAQGTILEEDIADGVITGPKLDDDSVDTDKILDGTILEEDIADEAISLPKLDEDSVDSDKIVDESITTDDILDETITSDDLAGDAITFNVDMRTLDITKTISPDETDDLTGSCSLSNEQITGFNVVSPDEIGPIGFTDVSISGNSLTVTVKNFNATMDIDSWQLILFCTSIIPAEATSSTSTGTGS